MASDIFLRLDGIKGESTGQAHMFEMDINSYSWVVEQVGVQNTGIGGGGSGKTSVHDIVIAKFVDIATPALCLFCVTGMHIKDGQITLRKAAGAKWLEFLKIRLEDILITNVSEDLSGTQSERINESIALNFARFFVEYTEQNASGGGTAAAVMGYDIKANIKL